MKAMALVVALLASGCADLEAQQQAQQLETKMVDECLKTVASEAATFDQKMACADFVQGVRARQAGQNAVDAQAYAAAGAAIAASARPPVQTVVVQPVRQPITCYQNGPWTNCY